MTIFISSYPKSWNTRLAYQVLQLFWPMLFPIRREIFISIVTKFFLAIFASQCIPQNSQIWGGGFIDHFRLWINRKPTHWSCSFWVLRVFFSGAERHYLWENDFLKLSRLGILRWWEFYFFCFCYFNELYAIQNVFLTPRYEVILPVGPYWRWSLGIPLFMSLSNGIPCLTACINS